MLSAKKSRTTYPSLRIGTSFVSLIFSADRTSVPAFQCLLTGCRQNLLKWLLPALIVSSAVISGCAKREAKPVPTVNELYLEALEAATRYPENTFLSPGNNHAEFHQTQSTLTETGSSDSEVGTAELKEAGSSGISSVVSPGKHRRKVTAVSSSSGAGTISEIFEETDVIQALQILATQAQVSFVIDNEIRGQTSVVLENDTVENALQKILLPLGYLYRFREGRYYIGAPDPESNLFPYLADSCEYRPVSLSTKELAELLPERFKQFVQIVDKRNIIQIEAPPQIAEDILTRLQQADQPVPQVVLEAMVCVINPNKSQQFGFDWNHLLQIQGLNAVNVGLSGLTFSGAASPAGVKNAFSDFAVTSVFVKLLAQEGYLKVRAAPRVMAKDGEKAKISINRETYFSSVPQSGSNQLLFVPNIERVEAGISLEITPTIRGEMIEVVIDKAEVSENLSLLNLNSQLTTNPYPSINRRSVNTTVQVPNGQTIVIGGLVQRQTVDRLSRIPGLGSIPGIGKLFQSIEKQEQDAEIVIFISPRIVYGGTEPAVMSAGAGIADSGVAEAKPNPPQVPTEFDILPPVTEAPKPTTDVPSHFHRGISNQWRPTR
jgi:type IV pilus assembly protein PilQ